MEMGTPPIYHIAPPSLYKVMESLVFKLQRFYNSCLTNYWLGVLRKLTGPKLKGQNLRSHHHQSLKVYACVVEAVPEAVAAAEAVAAEAVLFEFEEVPSVEVRLAVAALTFVEARTFGVPHYEWGLDLRTVGDHQ
jgi:hypothetical protein